MTITSLPTTPTPGPHATGKASAGDPVTADPTALGFLAELAAAITSVGNLAQVTGALPGTVPAASGKAAGATPVAAPSAAGPVLTAVPGFLAGSVLAGAPLAGGLPAATPPVPDAGQPTSALPLLPGLPGAPAPAVLPPGASADPAPAGASVVATPAATPAVTAVPAAPVAAMPLATETAPSTASIATPAAAEAPAAIPVHPRHAGRSETPAPAIPEPAPSTDQSTALLTPTSAAPPAAAATAVATGDGGRTTAVLQQVFPEITKLATAGNGTHRMTLTLHPDDLGTVRVTLSVRDGNVRVTLAADQATSALAAGRPELQRLLEQHGATDTRIVVRDLGSAPSPATTTGGDSHQPGQQYAAGGSAEDAPRGRQERPAVVPNPGRRPPTGPPRPRPPRGAPPPASTS